MDLLLSVIADPEGSNMQKHTKLFTPQGGSFGRADSNDWVLVDPQRVVSSRHAEIIFSDGRYFLKDVSTNGTYHNQSSSPVGNGNQIPLADGDVLALGDYRLKVSVRKPKPDSPLPKGVGGADFLDSADRTTFSAEAAAKMQSNKEAQELDSWLEPGAAAAKNHSGEWGYLVSENESKTNNSLEDFLGQEQPTDPLQVMGAGRSAQDGLFGGSLGNSDFDPLADLGGNSSPESVSSPALANSWGDDDAWWKDGSEQDHAPAHNHSMQIRPQQSSPTLSPERPFARRPAAGSDFDEHSISAPKAKCNPDNLHPQLSNTPCVNPQENPFAESFSEVAGNQIAGAPVLGEGGAGSNGGVGGDGSESADIALSSLHRGAVPASGQPAPESFSGMENAGLGPVSNRGASVAQGSQQFSTPSMATTMRPSPEVVPQKTSTADSMPFLAQKLGVALQGDQLTQFDRQTAAIVEESVGRLIDLLRARTSIKNELRVQRTMIQTEANNPLKFSATARDALDAMFTGNSAFMTPVDAVRDGFDDLSDHQVAVLSGMRAGYEAMLRYFNPDNIERRGGVQSGVFSSKSARNWDNYVEAYRELVSDPDSCYRRLFGEEFASTYENQLSELKNSRAFNK
ncbi:hypothetical protein Mag101_01530 [Microbulbifer agarilyticus]|uniref:FHA domain-containing protein n=1 Tax=Microbulbifer agarilyticus TaxID=260552 RepID=A0A1Q2M2L1_9GAMM|nr:type VI secretion system-associated FHA domain protein TagH [Microbulbifer agarilyticus]AQQ66472.1 hypothetical protein Mag101_01530 [Microbulbifer agarilyticus]